MKNVITHFDRRENMKYERLRSIMDIVDFPYTREYSFPGNTELLNELDSKIEKHDFSRHDFSNYLHGMLDGWDYTQTEDFKNLLDKLQLIDENVFNKVIEIVEEVRSYPRVKCDLPGVTLEW
jgi:hypothetical protein